MSSLVIFDLDGTLVDSRGDIVAACNHALASAGRPQLPAATIEGFVGDGGEKLIERALAATARRGAHHDATPMVSDVLAEFDRYYRAHPALHTVFLPGAREALDALREHPLALATNKSRASALAVLEALGISERFAAVSAGGDGPLKPDPHALLRICRALHAAPEDTFMVGDGPQDIGAGRAAGCITVAVLGGFHGEDKLRALAPDHLLGTLHELAAVVTANPAGPRSP